MLPNTLTVLLAAVSSTALVHADDCACGGGVIFEGQASGTMVRNFSAGVDAYSAESPTGSKENAILFMTDIFGLPASDNQLTADSLASAGYWVLMPDLFAGDPIPASGFTSPGFDMAGWGARHPPAAVDDIIARTLRSMRDAGAERVGAVGYCFGGKYVVRWLGKEEGGVDAGFIAHPSGLEMAEVTAVRRPLAIAAAQNDQGWGPSVRRPMIDALSAQGADFQYSLYSKVAHGFGVRADPSVREERFAKEGAYWQAVRLFDEYVKGAAEAEE